MHEMEPFIEHGDAYIPIYFGVKCGPRPARFRSFKPVDTAAALGSGSAPLPSLSQPRARALPRHLGSGPSPFKATRQPSKGRARAVGLRPNPLAGTFVTFVHATLDTSHMAHGEVCPD